MQNDVKRCLGDAQLYQEHVGGPGLAGGGRGRPESSLECGGRGAETAKLASIKELPTRFLA
jgi:hypothetical protein